jgi:hypothetical protein
LKSNERTVVGASLFCGRWDGKDAESTAEYVRYACNTLTEIQQLLLAGRLSQHRRFRNEKSCQSVEKVNSFPRLTSRACKIKEAPNIFSS